MPGLLASRGAVTFDRPIVLSGGGPPLGGPLTITVSPDSTCAQSQHNDYNQRDVVKVKIAQGTTHICHRMIMPAGELADSKIQSKLTTWQVTVYVR